MTNTETLSVRVMPYTTMIDLTKQSHSTLNNNSSNSKIIPHLLLNPNFVATFTG